MPILPLEQRKDLFEISGDLNKMIAYRTALLAQMRNIWVLIHHNNQTQNYGLEVITAFGNQCSEQDTTKIKEILRSCVAPPPPLLFKKARKKSKAKPKDQDN